MGRRKLILAIDMGTSSSRSALFDLEGRRVNGSLFQQTYPLRTSPEGEATIDPFVLEKSVLACISRTLASSSGATILGVGTSCFWHSLIGLSQENEPVTPVITWADSRCREDAARLRESLEEEAVHSRTGAMLRTSFWLPKFRWLKREKKTRVAGVHRWMAPSDWLYARWCGRHSTSHSMASGTGMVNQIAGTWDDELLRLAGVKAAQLGEISDEPLRTGKVLSRKFPALAEARWFPGIGDGAANNLGCGATEPGLAAVNFGTSAAMRIVVSGKRPQVPFGLFCYRIDERRWLVGGAISNAGSTRAWASEQFRVSEGEALEKNLWRRRHPVEGLTVLPFLTAERAPTWPDAIPSCILGMHQATTPLDLFQAVTDATYLRLGWIERILRERVARAPLAITISGGVLKSSSAMRRLADIFGREIFANTEPEGSLRGAAVIAIEHLGLSVRPLRRGKSYQPDAQVHEAYRRAGDRQIRLEKLIEQSSGLF